MGKRLVLIRHAKSESIASAPRDFDRLLNERGANDAPMMGKRLAEKSIKPELIVCSAAKRAVQTSVLLAEQLGYPEDKIIASPEMYEAGPFELLTIIQELDDDYNQVMLVGHNPSMTSLVDRLADTPVYDMSTCSACCLDFSISSWSQVDSGSGVFVFYDDPKN